MEGLTLTHYNHDVGKIPMLAPEKDETVRNNKSYKPIDSSNAVVSEGLSRWTDFKKLANEIAEVVSKMGVPILQ